MATAETKPHVSEFVNEPFIDFSQPANRKRMEEALKTVAGELGREYPMYIGGQKVTTAEMWWKQRRPEIVEDFEREVFGRVPKNKPKIIWTVLSNVVDGLVGKLPANGKQLNGHAEN